MKISLNQKSARKGFTLIEMIGVLAVIAILASLLIPKIFNAINQSRINGTVLSYNTVKTAVMDHYGKFGAFNAMAGGATASAAQLGSYDSLLLSEGLVDKTFQVKVGDGTTNTLVRCIVPPTSTNAVNFADGTYDLDGVAGVETAGSQYVAEAVITGVAEIDAQAISTILDGPTLSTAIGTDDKVGRVKYAKGSPTTLYIYIAHR